MKYVIIGGVAAGASAAARLRRRDEKAQIVLLERGHNISYANCGLPYFLGGVIPERENLLVMTAEKFQRWFNVDVRVESEVKSIDRSARTVTIENNGQEYSESYDKLLLATGAMPAPGSAPENNSRVFNLWTLKDMDKVYARLAGASKAIIVGAGFIGLEAAENLRERGLEVTVIQRGEHVLPTLDKEMASPLAAELGRLGIEVKFQSTVESYEETPDQVTVKLADKSQLSADVVIVSTGVVPNTKLAKEAGLECGSRGHIIVDPTLQTSDENIYAAGDAIEVIEPILGGKTAIPLAGPANKQGRIAADNMAGYKREYPGSIGTSVVKVGNLTAAGVGMTEQRLKSLGTVYRKLYLHPSSGASYYPGATRMSLKLLFGEDGTIFGAQIVGYKGVDKRIDSIAQAIKSKRKAPELGELELAYAPPYSSAKDPVNFAGFVSENILSGLSDVVYPDTIPADAQIIDVREAEEHDLGYVPGAKNIPLGEMRQRLNELDKERLTVVYCQVGLRGYLAERILKQNGYKAANLSGGYVTWKLFNPDEVKTATPAAKAEKAAALPAAITLDVRSLPCPGPVVKLKSSISELPAGSRIHLLAAPTFENDLKHWAQSAGHRVENLQHQSGHLEADVVKASGETAVPATGAAAAHSAAIVLFSNDLDKALAALILANGLAASGAKVGIFFTFWGLSVLRKDPAPKVRKNFISRMFGWMLPGSARKLALSKMNMLGMGTAMMKKVMQDKNVLTLPELLASARAAGVKFIACDMAMDVMGITREELIEVDEVAGVAAFAELAKHSNNTLFI